MAKKEVITLELDGREVRFSSPSKVFFSDHGWTKKDLLDYYLAVHDGIGHNLENRPTSMKRFPDGASGEFFFQKRVPKGAPEWIEQMTVQFPSGRNANYLLAQDRSHMAYALNLGVIDWNPWAVRNPDGDHPDELRIDLDPTPESSDWNDVRDVALCVREVLTDHELVGFPKTSGSRGIHIYVRIEQRWDFLGVRRAALALAREVERRMPGRATSKWWKEEREGVFLDYNQNARDRTIASAYSVRPNPDGLVSAPLEWEEVPDAELGDFRLDNMPRRLNEKGDPSAGLEENVGSLEALLELSERDEKEGLGDAPWPPHFAKQAGEPKRVAPSRAKKD
ncbi:MAG: DNA polymerase domain-containing protein [Thermoleophilaceae bacterium]|nr:DNA polymerase domain-containing protein [Thermoleophilaceae bacterium]